MGTVQTTPSKAHGDRKILDGKRISISPRWLLESPTDFLKITPSMVGFDCLWYALVK